jgi:predicted HAD superfamily Cof-like phosphohydrolase
MKSNFQSVGDFHEKFGLPVTGHSPLTIIDNSAFLFRYQFLMEELQELLSAHRSNNLAGVADALADLVYVALGTAHMYGIPFDEVFEEVQRANMTKERSKGSGDDRSKRGSSLDVVKPIGWKAPDINKVLKDFYQKQLVPKNGNNDQEIVLPPVCLVIKQKEPVKPIEPKVEVDRPNSNPQYSYTGVCSQCGCRIHKWNTIGLCPDCFTKSPIEHKFSKEQDDAQD